jgi:thioredoxin reductase (NADPH)
VALLLADQRMPGMTGTEFLEAAASIHPGAKRALLTAYADTNAAIDAINRADLDYYLLKPWDPPEERLYPTLDDLLTDWRSGYRPAFRGLRVVGSRWSADTHRIKDFLARNQVPYRWLDVETSDEAKTLLQTVRPVLSNAPTGTAAAANGAGPDSSPPLPVVFFPDGDPAVHPSNAALAERIGLKTQAADPFYDLVVVGAGPSGLAAAVYGASEGLHSLLIEREAPGGQAGTSSRIENYLGFPAGLSGADLARRASAQAQKFGVEILTPQHATALRIDGPYRYVTLSDGSEVACHALVIATGVQYRSLGLESTERLTGRGVYYGASTTEALACSGDDVFIVGAGNSAGQAALYLADYARQVTMLVRGSTLTKSMSMYLVERIETHPRIDVALHTELQEVHGDGHVEQLTLVDNRTEETRTVSGAAVFLFIGARPRTEWLGDAIARDPRGFVYTGPDLSAENRLQTWTAPRAPFLLETSVPGIFATGDVRHGSIKRVAAAVGEGSVAISAVHQHLGDL